MQLSIRINPFMPMENESLNLKLSLEYMFNIKISITNMMKKNPYIQISGIY